MNARSNNNPKMSITMKKHKIKRAAIDDLLGDMFTVEVEAEIYEYKGLQFGIYWEGQSEKAIIAIELQTGYSVAAVPRQGTKSPKKDLLQKIAHFVDKTNYEVAISRVISEREQHRRTINDQIRKLEQQLDCWVFPINERIEL